MIQVCHINITSIRKHKDELPSRFFKYDIISINESNLEKDRLFTLQGFNIFRNDRIDQSDGGVLLAMKESIKCHEIFNKAIEKNEIVAVQIESKTFKSILIASIYVPPTADIHLNVFHDLYKLNNKCLIVGDLREGPPEYQVTWLEKNF